MEEPLVVQDPYDRAPLTALVLFETEEPMEITVSVEGQTEDTTITHTYEGYETAHEVPVLGLYPDSNNQIILTSEAENGDTIETTLEIATDSLPEEILDITLVESDPERMQEGLTFLTPSRTYPFAVDSNGDVRWYGSITIDMDNIVNSAPLHHDTIILPNNNYLALLHDGSDEYTEDEIVELNRETGDVVNRINLKDIFPEEYYEEYSGHNDDVGDWVHVNAVWYLEDEDAILLSVRHFDMILKLTYPEGEIDWIFSHPQEWDERFEDYLLESEDENLKYPAGQHAVMEMPDQDNDDSTIDIMLFDNNRIFYGGDEEVNEEYSKAVQYRINQEENTVEEIWSYGEERGTDYYSHIVSDADYLPESETVLINSGRVRLEETDEAQSIITEVTKTENPEIVFEIEYGPFDYDNYIQIFRAERYSLYP